MSSTIQTATCESCTEDVDAHIWQCSGKAACPHGVFVSNFIDTPCRFHAFSVKRGARDLPGIFQEPCWHIFLQECDHGHQSRIDTFREHPMYSSTRVEGARWGIRDMSSRRQKQTAKNRDLEKGSNNKKPPPDSRGQIHKYTITLYLGDGSFWARQGLFSPNYASFSVGAVSQGVKPRSCTTFVVGSSQP